MAILRRRVPIVITLLCLNTLCLWRPWGSYDFLVIHHSASAVGDYSDIRRVHRARGWFEIAYHLVLSNGSTDTPHGHLFPTYRYRLGLWSTATRSRRHNLRGLHLCIIGDFEKNEVPTDLGIALGHAVGELQRRHSLPDTNILLHRECSPTACPGSNITTPKIKEWVALSESLPEEIRVQHKQVLSKPRTDRGIVIAGWLALNLLLLRALMASSRGRRNDL